MKNKNIKKVVSIVLGILMVGSLVACGESSKESKSSNEEVVVKADKEKYEVKNIKGVDYKILNNNLTYNTALGDLVSRFNSYSGKQSVQEDTSQYIEMYYGHKLDEKYGKTDWYRSDAKLGDGLTAESILYRYMFDKEKLAVDATLQDTEIVNFVKNVTNVELNDEETKKVSDKFNTFIQSNNGKDIISIQQENTYYTIVFKFDNELKVIDTEIYVVKSDEA